MSLIPLVDIDPGLLTSYATKRRGTRTGNGRLWPESELLQAGDMQRGRPEGHTMRCIRPLAAALQALDVAVRRAGGSRPRITDLHRPGHVAAEARRKYDLWVRVGKPHPSSRGFDPKTMKAAYVAPPNGTFHQAGMAVDFDIYAQSWSDAAAGTDFALGKLWGIAIPMGFAPIIRRPNIEQSESWHFDWMGPLEKVAALFARNGVHNTYSATAAVAVALTGQWAGDQGPQTWREIQALLNLAGVYSGRVDGVVGRRTRSAIASIRVGFNLRVDTSQSAPVILRALLDAGVAAAELAVLRGEP